MSFDTWVTSNDKLIEEGKSIRGVLHSNGWKVILKIKEELEKEWTARWLRCPEQEGRLIRERINALKDFINKIELIEKRGRSKEKEKINEG